ncbi:MAG: hypothetical protein H0X14_06040 [Acidobacteria bacterium]|nr:hypothetical protein [Acidobacteriota bacterium]
MQKKATTKVRKVKASKISKSKTSKSVSRTTKAASSLNSKSSSKTLAGRSAVSGKFISAKTGRVIKTSPAKPRLGRERIQTAVRSYVRRDDTTGKFVD